MEQWKTIPEFPNYMVSNWGRVKTVKRKIKGIARGTECEKTIKERIMKTKKISKNLISCQLKNEKGYRCVSVLKIAKELFKNVKNEDEGVLKVKKEEWKPIPNFEENYIVSNTGRVRALSRETITAKGKRVIKEKEISVQKSKNGLLFACLTKKKKQSSVSISKVIKKIFNIKGKAEFRGDTREEIIKVKGRKFKVQKQKTFNACDNCDMKKYKCPINLNCDQKIFIEIK